MDAALFTAGGAAAERALLAVRPGGRAAYPTGVQMGECAPNDVQLSIYNGEPDPEIIRRADSLACQPTFTIHVAQTYAMAEAAKAHATLDRHYLGKISLHISHDTVTDG